MIINIIALKLQTPSVLVKCMETLPGVLIINQSCYTKISAQNGRGRESGRKRTPGVRGPCQ